MKPGSCTLERILIIVLFPAMAVMFFVSHAIGACVEAAKAGWNDARKFYGD